MLFTIYASEEISPRYPTEYTVAETVDQVNWNENSPWLNDWVVIKEKVTLNLDSDAADIGEWSHIEIGDPMYYRHYMLAIFDMSDGGRGKVGEWEVWLDDADHTDGEGNTHNFQGPTIHEIIEHFYVDHFGLDADKFTSPTLDEQYSYLLKNFDTQKASLGSVVEDLCRMSGGVIVYQPSFGVRYKKDPQYPVYDEDVSDTTLSVKLEVAHTTATVAGGTTAFAVSGRFRVGTDTETYTGKTTTTFTGLGANRTQDWDSGIPLYPVKPNLLYTFSKADIEVPMPVTIKDKNLVNQVILSARNMETGETFRVKHPQQPNVYGRPVIMRDSIIGDANRAQKIARVEFRKLNFMNEVFVIVKGIGEWITPTTWMAIDWDEDAQDNPMFQNKHYFVTGVTFRIRASDPMNKLWVCELACEERVA